MSKVSVVARVRAKPDMQGRVKQELLRLVVETRKEAGCLNYDLHQSADDPAIFLFYENWQTREHLDRHAKSPHINAIRAKADELFAAPTEITLWEMVSQSA